MNEMTCREFDEIVHGYVRMELLNVRLREAVLEHTAVCSLCANRMVEAIALAEATEAASRRAQHQQTPPEWKLRCWLSSAAISGASPGAGRWNGLPWEPPQPFC